MPAVYEFRPRIARIVAWTLFAAVWAGTAVLLALSFTTFVYYEWPDRIMTVVFVGAGSAIIYRQAIVMARADSKGLLVRNLVRTTRLEWEEIVNVNFSPGRPWASLDLADGDTLAVMAIQSADGERALADARRLAALVEEHEGKGT